MNSLSFNASKIVRTKMLRDKDAIYKTARKFEQMLNGLLFPQRFGVVLNFTSDGLRATVNSSDSFDAQDIERVLFGKQEQEGGMFNV